MNKYVYTVQSEDVGRRSLKITMCPECGNSRIINYPGGVVLVHDIGKYIYEENDVFQVENQEQFERRIQSL